MNRVFRNSRCLRLTVTEYSNTYETHHKKFEFDLMNQFQNFRKGNFLSVK